MTRSLRQMHRRMILTVALAVPAIVAAGVMARAPEPGPNVLPLARATPGEGIRTLFAADDLWRRTRISTRISILPGEPDRRWIELDPREEFAHPDLLLYWSASRPGERLAPASRLLGALRGRGARRFGVPDDVDLRAGYLILYDLAHAEIFGIAEVPVQP